ncbi:MAG: galactose mutarotase [Geminicoccaceae bacterium]|nr:galactose mutarotase [Geminicoccaceae bacterium]
MAVLVEPAGTVEEGTVMRALLRGRRGLEAAVSSFGATLQWLRVPGSCGEPVDLVLGYDRPEEYARRPGYLGATVGRFANRIAHGRFWLDGRLFRLPCNQDGRHHLHGGPGALSHRIWSLERVAGAEAVRLAIVSPDGDNGYPGRLEVSCTYALEEEGLAIELEATTDAPTPVNLVHHSYWNLAGGGTIDDHHLELAADRVLEVDADLIPTGRILAVDGTPLDYRAPRRLDDRGPPALDHCFLVPGVGFRRIGTLEHRRSRRALELWSDQPAVQVYSAIHLDVPGRGGVRYGPRAGLCLETEALPDAPNHPHFPSAILRPGERYRHRMLFRLRF